MATMVDEGGIYRLETSKERVYFAAKIPMAELWHRRLGHLNNRSAKTLNEGMAQGISIKCFGGTKCVTRIKGKHHRTPFPKEGKRASHAGVDTSRFVQTPGNAIVS